MGLVDVGKAGTHYLEYSSPLPGTTALVPKLGYSEYLTKWDMVVGSSVNLDGIDAKVAEVEKNVNERVHDILISIVGITALVLLVIALLGIWTASSILRPLHLMKANLDDIAAGEGDLNQRLGMLVGQFRI